MDKRHEEAIKVFGNLVGALQEVLKEEVKGKETVKPEQKEEQEPIKGFSGIEENLTNIFAGEGLKEQIPEEVKQILGRLLGGFEEPEEEMSNYDKVLLELLEGLDVLIVGEGAEFKGKLVNKLVQGLYENGYNEDVLYVTSLETVGGYNSYTNVVETSDVQLIGVMGVNSIGEALERLIELGDGEHHNGFSVIVQVEGETITKLLYM